MALFYGPEILPTVQVPFLPTAAPGHGAHLVGYQTVINHATLLKADGTTQAGLVVANADAVMLARPPAGLTFAFGMLNSNTSLGSTVIAIGTSSTHASNGQYRAAAVFTATNTPTLFGVVAAADDTTPLASQAPVWLTAATADGPTTGILIVTLFYWTKVT